MLRRQSARAWWKSCYAAVSANLTMMVATVASGYRQPNQETASAAKITATSPMASLRLHSQTESILLSPVRNPNMSAAQITFAKSANVPIDPITMAPGTPPDISYQMVLPSTLSLNAVIEAALSIAAPVRQRRLAVSTIRQNFSVSGTRWREMIVSMAHVSNLRAAEFGDQGAILPQPQGERGQSRIAR